MIGWMIKRTFTKDNSYDYYNTDDWEWCPIDEATLYENIDYCYTRYLNCADAYPEPGITIEIVKVEIHEIPE